MKVNFTVIAVAVMVVVSSWPLGAQGQGRTSTQQPAQHGHPAHTIIYRNNRYGFTLTLPASWKGYSVHQETWGGSGEIDGKDIEITGPQIFIRHPKWTDDDPWQDIPIMIFTHAQWELVDGENVSVSAAPFGPGELARNGKFVFALPPRYNYGDARGTDEVSKILAHHSFRAFNSGK